MLFGESPHIYQKVIAVFRVEVLDFVGLSISPAENLLGFLVDSHILEPLLYQDLYQSKWVLLSCFWRQEERRMGEDNDQF